jgi:hypothetical protein
MRVMLMPPNRSADESYRCTGYATPTAPWSEHSPLELLEDHREDSIVRVRRRAPP